MPSHIVKLVNQKEMSQFPQIGSPLFEVTDARLLKAKNSDVVWLFRVEQGKAYLVAKLIVGGKAELPSRAKMVILRVGEGMEEPVKEIDLTKAGIQLEFMESTGNLGGLAYTESGGRIGSKATIRRGIQSGREITPSVAETLEGIWASQ